MFDYELERVEKVLSRLIHKGLFVNRDIYLFGVGENTRQIIRILRCNKLDPVHILDNDKTRQNTYCSGIQVISVENVEQIQNPKKLYLVYSSFWREMKAQLEMMGVKPRNILVLFKESSLHQCFWSAIRGRKVYERLVSGYGDVPVFVCPYTGTGDIYLIGTFWKQFVEKNHISDYIFVVISKACEKTAKLFPIKNITLIDKKESCYLISFHMLCPEKTKVTLLNDSWPQIHTNPLEWFRGYKGLEFTYLFRKFVFDLPETAKPEHPIFRDARKEIEALFDKTGLEKGNTVILSPYSNTLADLPERFWSRLARKLKRAGFKVCTNSSGETEPAVSGTVPIFFPLDIAPQVVEWAGYFVGIRSGLCDIISGTRARKILLYHAEERFFNGSVYEYFNLKDMGLCEDAVEICFGNEIGTLHEDVVKAVISGSQIENLEVVL